MSRLILECAVMFSIGCFALSMIMACMRLLKGPKACDRALALDTMYMIAMMVILILGVLPDSGISFDIALLMALFGFAGTLAIAKFLLYGEVIDP